MKIKISQLPAENTIQSKEKNENKKRNSEKKIIQKLTIIFTFRNEDCSISINPEITIIKLKQKIGDIIKLDSDKFSLIYNETEITNSNYTKTCKEFFNYPKINSNPILIIKKKQRSSVSSDNIANSKKYNNKVKIINFPSSNKELIKITEEFFKQNSLSSDYICDHNVDDDILSEEDVLKGNNNKAHYTIRFSSPNLAFDFNRYLCYLKLMNEKYKNIKISIILAKKKSINKIESSRNINNLKEGKAMEKNYSDLSKKINSKKYFEYFNKEKTNKNIYSNDNEIENIENFGIGPNYNYFENEITIKPIEIKSKEQNINEENNNFRFEKYENTNNNEEKEQKVEYNSISKKESRKIILRRNEEKKDYNKITLNDINKNKKYQINSIQKNNTIIRNLTSQNNKIKESNKQIFRIKSMPDIEEQKILQENKESEFMDTFQKLKKDGGEMNYNFVNFSGLNISTYKNDKRWVDSEGVVNLKNIPFIRQRYYYNKQM